MAYELSRQEYAARYGPTTGDRVRLVLLCQILSEHSSLNDSVVIHHTTA
jgi:urease alpha subunit